MTLLGVFLSVFLVVGVLLMRRRKLIAIDLVVVLLVMLAHAIVALTIALNSNIVIRSGSATNFELTRAETAAAGLVFLQGAMLFILAALILAPVVRSCEAEAATLGRSVAPSPKDWVAIVVGPTVLRAITGFGILFAAGSWTVNGAGFLSRDTYQFLTPGGLGATFSLLTLPISIAVAFAAFAARNSFDRIISGIALAALALAELSTASRGFAVVVAAVSALAVVFAARGLLARTIVGVIGGILTVVALSLTIQLRGGPPTQGLTAYIPWILGGSFDLGPVALQAATSNLLLSIPVGYKSALAPLPEGFLVISLNPLAGSDSGWYLISPYLQLGYQTPSNGFGQLMAGPVAEQAIGIAAVAVLLSLPTFFRRSLPARSRAISQFISVALTTAGSLQLLQYSLRAGMRFVWAGVALAVGIWVWNRISHRGPKSEPSIVELDGRLYIDGALVQDLPAPRREVSSGPEADESALRPLAPGTAPR